MGYRHIDVIRAQSPKKPGAPCGDVVEVRRTAKETLVVCGDGLGSGIKANIDATMCITRLLGLIAAGYSLREAFASLVRTMNAARQPGLPFTAFSLARFLPSGETTILSYEAPPPILVTGVTASLLRQHTHELEGAMLGEAHCFLDPGEGVLLVSDGITQAGLGVGLPEGWGIEGVCHAARDHMRSGKPKDELPAAIHEEARGYWGRVRGDDCTACLASCRKGKVVTVFTGPPIDRAKDHAAVAEFLRIDGTKVVCGATTATVVARFLGTRVQISEDSLDTIAPPYYKLEGIDLVTEGSVTLNQVFNILEENPERYEPNSGVSKLAALLKSADRINFLVGRAENIANKDISYRQQGIFPRTTIVPLLEQKLRQDMKLVVTRYC